MTAIRTALLLLSAAAAVYGILSSYNSYERLQFYTLVEPDFSLAESYELELRLKVPATPAAIGASLAAAALLFGQRAV